MNTTVKKKVPELRFREFEGEWGEKNIGNCTTKVGSGSTPKGGEKVYTKTGIPFIRSQNVNNDSLLLEEVSYIPKTIDDQMKGSRVNPLDILLNITGASIGRSCVVPKSFEKGNVNQHVSIIRLKKDFSPHFFQAYLSSFNGQKSILRSQVGSGREGLNFQSIRLLKLFAPSLPEQQKIANFLTAIDTRIQQLTQQKSLLEQYKKGVMQQLFSQEIRFKRDDGGDFSEWEEKQLGEVCNFTQGIQIPYSEQINKIQNGYIRYLYIRDFFSNEYACYVKNEYPNKIIRHNEIMMVNTGNTAGKAYKGKIGVLSNNCFKITYDSEVIDTEYLFIFLTSDFTQKKIQSFFNVGGQPHLGHKNIALLPFIKPCFSEQQKIANFLTVLDQRIERVGQQEAQMQAYKKGLLQQMFI